MMKHKTGVSLIARGLARNKNCRHLSQVNQAHGNCHSCVRTESDQQVIAETPQIVADDIHG